MPCCSVLSLYEFRFESTHNSIVDIVSSRTHIERYQSGRVSASVARACVCVLVHACIATSLLCRPTSDDGYVLYARLSWKISYKNSSHTLSARDSKEKVFAFHLMHSSGFDCRPSVRHALFCAHGERHIRQRTRRSSHGIVVCVCVCLCILQFRLRPVSVIRAILSHSPSLLISLPLSFALPMLAVLRSVSHSIMLRPWYVGVYGVGRARNRARMMCGGKSTAAGVTSWIVVRWK